MVKKRAKAKKPHGRPSIYTKAIAALICGRLAAGESLRAICRDENMPQESTVRAWALDDVHGFYAQYAKAREIGYSGMADELLEIADETSRDTIKNKSGDEVADTEWISRSRLRVDTRKWMLSKVLPKVYGDKVTADITADVTHNTEQPVSTLQLARDIAFALTLGMQAQAPPSESPDTPTTH